MGPKLLKNALAVVLAFLVLGATSQAAVCELACAVQVNATGCPMPAMQTMGQPSGIAGHTAAMGMSQTHCSHGAAMDSVLGSHRAASDCFSASCADAGGCSHRALAISDRGPVAGVSVDALQHLVIDLSPVHPVWLASRVGVVERSRLVTKGPGSPIVSLRV